ncbi:hypothetical protein [Pseudoroseicyclus aestuarii]|uniref:Uncharacterized protein n=1 Tax=Pseudoroseicyclus aestuarii TaxID=1795041 RepID=A0A318SPL4_9RHOB|nr:hypothetical protein [Pseudoroseicyclus aestuarii]PYE82576.1 hypothetical protein DFP88_104333 [Pseudoroseicyclus aestuarii]
MAISKDELLVIYRRNLKRYGAEGDADKAEIERQLIARIEAR